MRSISQFADCIRYDSSICISCIHIKTSFGMLGGLLCCSSCVPACLKMHLKKACSTNRVIQRGERETENGYHVTLHDAKKNFPVRSNEALPYENNNNKSAEAMNDLRIQSSVNAISRDAHVTYTMCKRTSESEHFVCEYLLFYEDQKYSVIYHYTSFCVKRCQFTFVDISLTYCVSQFDS